MLLHTIHLNHNLITEIFMLVIKSQDHVTGQITLHYVTVDLTFKERYAIYVITMCRQVTGM